MPEETQSAKSEETVKVQSKRSKETTMMTVPKRLMHRPFPLGWGLMATGLFMLFVIVTQIQVAKLANEKLDRVKQEAYLTDVRAYDAVVKANADCLLSIKIRATYRDIFTSIAELFHDQAELPVVLFPTSQEAIIYQQTLDAEINQRITQALDNKLPVKDESECPQIPTEKPVSPK